MPVLSKPMRALLLQSLNKRSLVNYVHLYKCSRFSACMLLTGSLTEVMVITVRLCRRWLN